MLQKVDKRLLSGTEKFDVRGGGTTCNMHVCRENLKQRDRLYENVGFMIAKVDRSLKNIAKCIYGNVKRDNSAMD